MKTFIFSIVAIFVSISNAQTQQEVPEFKPVKIENELGFVKDNSRLGRINKLIHSFNERFDTTGKFLWDPYLGGRFAFEQDVLINEFKKENALSKLFRLENNLDGRFNYAVYGMTSEQGDLLAIAVIPDKPNSPESWESSFLRVFPLHTLNTNRVVLGAFGRPAVSLQANNFNSSAGGKIKLQVAANLKKNQFQEIHLPLVPSKEGWQATDVNGQQKISTIQANLWVNILTFNGGVRELLWLP